MKGDKNENNKIFNDIKNITRYNQKTDNEYKKKILKFYKKIIIAIWIIY